MEKQQGEGTAGSGEESFNLYSATVTISDISILMNRQVPIFFIFLFLFFIKLVFPGWQPGADPANQE